MGKLKFYIVKFGQILATKTKPFCCTLRLSVLLQLSFR